MNACVKEVTIPYRKKYEIQTEQDDQGISWKVHFEPKEAEDEDSNEGLEVTIQIDSPSTDNLLCPMIAVITFHHATNSTKLYTDYFHIFTEESRTSAPVNIYGRHLDKLANKGHLRITVDIRKLVQSIPLY